MIQINPKERFVISRGLPDASDTSTYYIRAFVRDAIKDSLLATVTLTDKGSQRFQAEYEAPPDPTGNGVQIIISTVVYTDSGYTTISPDYGIEYVEYLVQTRYNPALPQNGMVGDDINYKKIRKIVEEVVKDNVNGIVSSISNRKDVDITAIGKDVLVGIDLTINNLLKDVFSRIDDIERSLKDNKTVYVQQEAGREFKKEIKQMIRDVDNRIDSIKEEIGSINVSPVVSVEKDKFGEMTFQFLKKLFTKKKDAPIVITKKIGDEFSLGYSDGVGLINEFNLKI